VKYHGEKGMDPALFQRYEKVLSGHFHCKQDKDNIYYLGTQYQITFADLDDPKGFHILDTETRELEFIENPFRMFHTVKYNDKEGPIELEELDFSYMNGCYVKVFVEYKKHPYSFDRFMDKLYESGVAKITVIEDVHENEVTDDAIDLAQDTVTLINNEIDTLEEVDDKDKLKRIIKDLYMESLSL
jgi:hypothetical protein